MSMFEQERRKYSTQGPEVLRRPLAWKWREDVTRVGAETRAIRDVLPTTSGQNCLSLTGDGTPTPALRRKVGVVFSGGPAPGGHNVIAGLFDALKGLNPESQVLGFLGGPSGILQSKTLDVTQDLVDRHRNMGGFHLLGSGRTKIHKVEEFVACQKTLESHGCDGLVIIGGDDSNTNAALLAEYLRAQGSPLTVVGVPKTIDGDLKNSYVPTSFGFDTAAHVYSELVGNLAYDALSSRKYYHFVRLMGRSASHITLETALQVCPTYALISEEIAHRNTSLGEIVQEISEIVIRRAGKGIHYGVVLVPEGVVEFVPSLRRLIAALNLRLVEHSAEISRLPDSGAIVEFVMGRLDQEDARALGELPREIQHQLVWERDPHDNVQVSKIESEKLLAQMVQDHLAQRRGGDGKAVKFSALTHFFGYEGRSAAPTNFDANYTYALGQTAAALISAQRTGYMAVMRRLARSPSEWQPEGVPLSRMMTIEIKGGKPRPVIGKGLVDIQSRAFQRFVESRKDWAESDAFRFPGPIQYFGPAPVTDVAPLTVQYDEASL